MKSVKERAPAELAVVKNRVARAHGRGSISLEDMNWLLNSIQKICDYIEEMEESDNGEA